MAGFLRAQDENWALRFFDNFLGDGAERNSAPSGHAVSGDNDHIRVFVLRDSHDFHADVVGSSNLRANRDVLSRKTGGKIRKALRSCIVETLIVFVFFEKRHTGRQIRNRLDNIHENQLGAEARGEVGGKRRERYLKKSLKSRGARIVFRVAAESFMAQRVLFLKSSDSSMQGAMLPDHFPGM